MMNILHVMLKKEPADFVLVVFFLNILITIQARALL